MALLGIIIAIALLAFFGKFLFWVLAFIDFAILFGVTVFFTITHWEWHTVFAILAGLVVAALYLGILQIPIIKHLIPLGVIGFVVYFILYIINDSLEYPLDLVWTVTILLIATASLFFARRAVLIDLGFDDMFDNAFSSTKGTLDYRPCEEHDVSVNELQQMSRTLLFMDKHNLTAIEQLESMATQNAHNMQNIKNNIAEHDAKLMNILELQRHIGAYGKTKEVYTQYKKAADPEAFRAANLESIVTHELAKKHFNENGYGFTSSGSKMPSMENLQEKYAMLNTERNVLWRQYQELKHSKKEIENAYPNVKAIYNVRDDVD